MNGGLMARKYFLFPLLLLGAFSGATVWGRAQDSGPKMAVFRVSVDVVQLEFRSLLERVQRSHEYEACLLSLASPDADPNPDMAVWLSSGGNHLWNPEQKTPATPWEAEIDRLMRSQMVARSYAERKRLFDRVQAIVVENQPLVPLVSPNLLAGAKKDLANFQPALLEPYTLWNVERLYWRGAASGAHP